MTDNPREMLLPMYGKSFVAEMSDSEAAKLWELHQQHGEAFDAICDALVSRRGQDKSALSDEQTDDIIEQAESLIEDWDEADTAGRTQRATTPVTAALKRHHDIGLEVMNHRDVIVTRVRVWDDGGEV